MKSRTLLAILLAALSLPISGCDSKIPSINEGKAEIREVDIDDYSFVYYEDGAGSLFSKSTGEPLYETLDCSFKEEGWESIGEGDSIVDIAEAIGFPRFTGIALSPSLDFGYPDSSIHRVFFTEDFSYYSSIVADTEDVNIWLDVFKKDLPSRSDAQKLERGMTMDEVVTLIGKPQSLYGGGDLIYLFKLDDGSILWTHWYSTFIDKEYNSVTYLDRVRIYFHL